MLRNTMEQMKKELEFGTLVIEKYLELLGIEKFYIEGKDVEDYVEGIEKESRCSFYENENVNFMRRNDEVHKQMNEFLNNHSFLVQNNIALIYALRVDSLHNAIKKYNDQYLVEVKEQLMFEEQQKAKDYFIQDLKSL